MNVILLGAPGAGKGTMADIVCQKLGLPVISTGYIIREAMKNGTEAGLRAKSYVEAGNLVPDGVVIAMLQDRISEDDCKNGFVLDGFPRTVPQAEALEEMGVEIDRVISLEAPDETILKRLTGRRVCERCSASYHLEHNPPKVAGVCDKCGGEVKVRQDDEPSTVRQRLQIYHNQTAPLKDYYQSRGKLRVVPSQEQVAETARLTEAALEAVEAGGL